MDYKSLIVVIIAVALAGAGGFLMGRNPNPQAGGFYTNGFASSTLTTIPVTLATGGTNATSQTTNGVCYDSGTLITCSTGLTFGSGKLSVGSTTPNATLQVTPTGSNATTSVEFGKASQNKGTCITYFDTAGTAVYGFIAAGATSFTYSNTEPSGCQI